MKKLLVMAMAFCAVNVMAQTDKTCLSLTYEVEYLRYAEDEPAYHSMMLPSGGRITMSDKNGRPIVWEAKTAITFERFINNKKK